MGRLHAAPLADDLDGLAGGHALVVAVTR